MGNTFIRFCGCMVVLATVLVVVSGCGSTVGDAVEYNNSTSTYTYQFRENGCDTGKRTFSNKADLCEGLRSNSLNNGCAQNLRKRHFELNCSGGSFYESY